MKIESIYISAFGKLKNFRMDFSDGLNIILGENEHGKTTIMSFIKMMFYGSDRGSSQLSKNIRKKNVPWDSSVPAGQIDFEFSGKKFRLEREFRSSNSTDKVFLFDRDLGEKQSVPSDVGLSIFGLSLAAFERSVFIGQFGFPTSDNEALGELDSKLSNIAFSGDENISFQQVNSRLENAKYKLMSKSGKSGEYDKNLQKLLSLKEALKKHDEKIEALNEEKEKLTLLKEEIENLTKTREEFKAQIAKEEDIKNAQKYKKLLALKSQLDEKNKALVLSDGSLVDDLYVKKLQFCISQKNELQNKFDAKQGEISTLKTSIETGINPPEDATEENKILLTEKIKTFETEILSAQEKIKSINLQKENLEQESTKKPSIIPAIVSVVLLALGIALFVLKYMLFGVVSSGIGVALFVVYLISAKKYKDKEESKAKALDELTLAIQKAENDINAKLNEKNAILLKLETITTALNATKSVLENQQALLSNLEKEAEELKAELKESTETMLSVFARYKTPETPEEINIILEEISKKSEEIKAIKNELNFIVKDLGNISYSEAEEKLKALNGVETDASVDFSALKERFENISTALSEKKSEFAVLASTLKSEISSLSNKEALQNEIKALEEECQNQKAFCDSVDIAMSVLAESLSETRRGYGKVLNEKTSEFFSLLTGGNYKGMTISKSFDINVEKTDDFLSRELDYLSSGTVDQAYLSLRLALASLICKDKENLPILLDDALAQYDDKRLETALSFLSELSEKNQILLFSCHNSVAEIAKKYNASIKEF